MLHYLIAIRKIQLGMYNLDKVLSAMINIESSNSLKLLGGVNFMLGDIDDTASMVIEKKLLLK